MTGRDKGGAKAPPVSAKPKLVPRAPAQIEISDSAVREWFREAFAGTAYRAPSDAWCRWLAHHLPDAIQPTATPYDWLGPSGEPLRAVLRRVPKARERIERAAARVECDDHTRAVIGRIAAKMSAVEKAVGDLLAEPLVAPAPWSWHTAARTAWALLCHAVEADGQRRPRRGRKNDLMRDVTLAALAACGLFVTEDALDDALRKRRGTRKRPASLAGQKSSEKKPRHSRQKSR